MASNQEEIAPRPTITLEQFTRRWSGNVGKSGPLPSDATLTFGQSGQHALMARLGRERESLAPLSEARETHGGGPLRKVPGTS